MTGFADRCAEWLCVSAMTGFADCCAEWLYISAMTGFADCCAEWLCLSASDRKMLSRLRRLFRGAARGPRHSRDKVRAEAS